MPVTIQTGVMKYKDPTTGNYVGIDAVGENIIDDASGFGETGKVWSSDKSVKELADKAPVILESASGSIAAFSDGADGLPIKVTADIIPEQEFNGYDAPWAPGCGKNKFQTTATTDTVSGITFTVNADGSVKVSGVPSAGVSNYIFGEVTLPAGTYKVNGFASGASNGIRMAALNKATSDVLGLVYGGNDVEFTLESETTVKVYPIVPLSFDGTAVTFYPMIRLSTVTDATFAPYSNICPFTGWRGANIFGASENLWDLTTYTGIEYNPTVGSTVTPVKAPVAQQFVNNGDGTFTVTFPNSTYQSVALLFWKKADQTYRRTIKIKASGNRRISWVWLDKDFKVLQVTNNTSSSDITNDQSLSTGTYSRWMCLVIHTHTSSGISVTIENPLITLGTGLKTYTPYQGSIHQVEFPNDAGTVYGGTLAVNEDGTGVLTVDKESVTLTGDESETWIKSNGTSTYSYNNAYFRHNYKPTNYAVEYSAISNMYEQVTIGSNTTDVGVSINNSSAALMCCIFVRPQGAKDLSIDDFTASLALNPLQVVYTLATPIVYNLTALQVINTLKGLNNIWADTGDVSADYRADTELFVNKSIPSVPVQDVQVNGTSILSSGVANIPIAAYGVLGAVKLNADYGVNATNGRLQTTSPSETQIKEGIISYRVINPSNQHQSVFYGLAKASGDTTQSASSNAVGVYTDNAKVAIQKMLGIYEAPWELIREDTFTNATEADYYISVDGNGNAYELTDCIILFETPKQETYSAKGSSGGITYYDGATPLFGTEAGAWTQSENGNAHGLMAMVEQKGKLLMISSSAQTSSTNFGNVRWRYGEGLNVYAQNIRLLENRLKITNIRITAVTGTGHYVLIGKRKWT